MIPSIAYMLMYLSYGVMTVHFLLPRHRPLNRIWLGLSLGLLEEMWLPALCAFFVGFTALGHVIAAGILLVITLLCFVFRDRREAAGWDRKEKSLLIQILAVGLPLTVLSAYLQYTHVMRVSANGSWWVGQSTYGDLPMHLSFITNLVGKKFPADYPFYPGNQLSYPFLTDSLSSTFYLFGASLQAATIIPATLMMSLCFMGVMVLAREMTAGKKTVVLVALLFFLNGGLGFLYNFDLIGEDASPVYLADLVGEENVPSYLAGEIVNKPVGGASVAERIDYILTEYYKTPTNRPEDFNLRWSNVICDMMVPQRTLLGGWCMVIPCFYLMSSALRPRKIFEDRYGTTDGSLPVGAPGVFDNRGDRGRSLVMLGIWAGALPLIHTHSFLALGLMSLGAMCYDLICGEPKALAVRRSRGRILARYAIYGGIAAALALPQLLCFTFSQALTENGSRSFIRFQFNWVNNPSGEGLRDMYLWFYIKNIGLPFIVLLLAAFEKNPRHRRIFAMMLPVILAAEFICFQPNEYDNNKLFYLAWLMGCMIIADWCAEVWKRLKGMRGRYVLAVLAAIVTFLSAGLTIWRECRSRYQAFSADAVEIGEYVRDYTESDVVFMTGFGSHLNPVLSIGGKTVVCGPDLWLYWHGFDTAERHREIRAFFEDPDRHADILQKYGVSYIYVAARDRWVNQYGVNSDGYWVDEEALRREYEVVFENREGTIYKVPEG